jgi:hypothetical protein
MALFSTSETISGNLIFDAHESPRMSESRGTLSGSQSLGHAFHRSRPEAEMEKPLLPKDGESAKKPYGFGSRAQYPENHHEYDAGLISQVLGGDAERFGQLIERYQRQLYSPRASLN